jgi:hypothetical protein
MKKQILNIAKQLENEEITTDNAETLLLGLFSVTSRFSETELNNVLSKVKKVKIKENFKDVLVQHFGLEEFTKEDDTFFNRYKGKEVNIYEWCGDMWIAEDDNYIITRNCFDRL